MESALNLENLEQAACYHNLFYWIAMIKKGEWLNVKFFFIKKKIHTYTKHKLACHLFLLLELQ